MTLPEICLTLFSGMSCLVPGEKKKDGAGAPLPIFEISHHPAQHLWGLGLSWCLNVEDVEVIRRHYADRWPTEELRELDNKQDPTASKLFSLQII